MPRASWLEATTNGCILTVHVRPGASRAGVVGLHGEALAVRTCARAVDGAANRELTQVLAQALGVGPRSVVITTGAHARTKRVHVEGLTPEQAHDRLRAGYGTAP